LINFVDRSRRANHYVRLPQVHQLELHNDDDDYENDNMCLLHCSDQGSAGGGSYGSRQSGYSGGGTGGSGSSTSTATSGGYSNPPSSGYSASSNQATSTAASGYSAPANQQSYGQASYGQQQQQQYQQQQQAGYNTAAGTTATGYGQAAYTQPATGYAQQQQAPANTGYTQQNTAYVQVTDRSLSVLTLTSEPVVLTPCTRAGLRPVIVVWYGMVMVNVNLYSTIVTKSLMH